MGIQLKKYETYKLSSIIRLDEGDKIAYYKQLAEIWRHRVGLELVKQERGEWKYLRNWNLPLVCPMVYIELDKYLLSEYLRKRKRRGTKFYSMV